MAPHAPPLEAHRAIGDGHTVALVRPDAEVDWWCVPAMDADPLLWSLLDPDGGAARLLDTAPARGSAADDPPRGRSPGPWCAPRTVRSRSSTPSCRARSAAPRWCGCSMLPTDRSTSATRSTPAGSASARRDGTGPRWTTSVADGTCTASGPRRGASSPRGGVVAELTVGRDGDRGRPDAAIIITADPTIDLRLDDLAARVDAARAAAVGGGTSISGLALHPERVRDAFLVMQVCTYEPTGAVVAAPTTSLPEAPGHDRQFDYRYSWLRDSSMAASVAAQLGQVEMSRRHLCFIEELGPERLLTSPLFRVDGGAVPAEREISGVQGWAGSRPVRVGNAATLQVQYDGPGFVNEAIDIHVQRGGELTPDLWSIVTAIADRSAEPDHVATSGIWELRRPDHLVVADTGRWMALDHAVRLGEHQHLEVAPRWRHARDAAHDRVLRAVQPHGLPQSYAGPPRPDASALLNVICGMITPDDPRSHVVVDGVIDQLARRPLVWRYPADATDGFSGREGRVHPRVLVGRDGVGHPRTGRGSRRLGRRAVRAPADPARRAGHPGGRRAALPRQRPAPLVPRRGGARPLRPRRGDPVSFRRHIALVGPMGSGKSTIGQQVADHLGTAFVDNDVALEHRVGADAASYAAAHGRAALHEVEATLLLEALLGTEPSVMATAASIIEDSGVSARPDRACRHRLAARRDRRAGQEGRERRAPSTRRRRGRRARPARPPPGSPLRRGRRPRRGRDDQQLSRHGRRDPRPPRSGSVMPLRASGAADRDR